MFFEIEKELLSEGMSKIVSITERRSPLPILTHALIEVKDQVLSITGTDLEVGIRVIYNCLNGSDGLATIPARKFLKVIFVPFRLVGPTFSSSVYFFPFL